MPNELIACVSLPPASITSVPIYDYALANEELANMGMEVYYPCCGKGICFGCTHSFCRSGNTGKCPFCNSNRDGKTDEDKVKELKKRVEANDAGAIYALGNSYYNGLLGLQQDGTKAMELYARAAELGSSKAHHQIGHLNCNLDDPNNNGGDFKKAKFHYEAAAMAGNEVARKELGVIELKYKSNLEQSIKHLMIAASAGEYHAMQALILFFDKGVVSRDAINSVLTAYNNSCAEMRSEARDACIRDMQLGKFGVGRG
jgi:TPR repeat protein